VLALICSLLLSCGHDFQLSGDEQVFVSTTFESKLAQQIADIPRNAERARAVYSRLRPLLERYNGGMPAGFMAAIASFESGGKMSSTGDSTLGEVGIFQITKSFPGKVGLPADSRFNEEVNVFLGGIEYQIMAVEMHLANPRIRLGTPDNWKLARLAFAIGAPGTKKLLEQSGASSWPELVRWVDAQGGVALGRQSAGKVWFRVHVIDVLWQIGLRVKPIIHAQAPVRVPNSPAGAYTLPEQVEPYIPSHALATVGAFGLVGVVWAARKVIL
jgi:hypothetical protein